MTYRFLTALALGALALFPVSTQAQDPSTVIFATPLVRILEMPSTDAFSHSFLGTPMLVSTEPLVFGSVQINRAGQVSLSLSGAMPTTDYRLYFCPFLKTLDGCTQVGDQPTTTDRSGNGVNVHQWSYTSSPVAGTFLVVWGSDPVMASFISGFQVPAVSPNGGRRGQRETTPKVHMARAEPGNSKKN